jgi:hypothetical protein
MMVWFMQACREDQVQIQPVGTSVKYAKQNTTISKHRALPRSVCASSIHVWHYFYTAPSCMPRRPILFYILHFSSAILHWVYSNVCMYKWKRHTALFW